MISTTHCCQNSVLLPKFLGQYINIFHDFSTLYILYPIHCYYLIALSPKYLKLTTLNSSKFYESWSLLEYSNNFIIGLSLLSFIFQKKSPCIYQPEPLKE